MKKEDRFIEKIRQVHLKVWAQLKKFSRRTSSDMTSIGSITYSVLGTKCGFVSGRNAYKEAAKKLKPLRYGPFKIIEQVNANAFKLNLPLYMGMYSEINVENLQLFKPSLLYR